MSNCVALQVIPKTNKKTKGESMSRLDTISKLKEEKERLTKELDELTTWEEDVGGSITDALSCVSNAVDDTWSSFKGLFA